MPKVIVNADDFGLNSSVNGAIINLFKNNIINSSTLMANMPGFDEAIELIHENNLKDKIGIHLVLTSGRPVNDVSICKGYYFSGKDNLKRRFIRNPFYLNNDETKFIYNEFTSQIEKVQEKGIPITHIDTHHHVHEYFFITRIVSKLAIRFNIPSVRILCNTEISSMFYKKVYRKMINGYLKYRRNNFTDLFGSQSDYLRLIKSTPEVIGDKTFEIMVHPDFNDYGEVVDRLGDSELSFHFVNEIKHHLF